MRLFASLLPLSLCAGFAFAQVRGPVASYRDIKFPALNNVKVPEPTRFELSNGMIVYLVEDHELPTFSATALIRTGGRLEPANKAGLAAITGSVMRTGGSVKESGDQLDVELDRRGASVEIGIGGTSGSASAGGLKEDGPRMLAILADLLQHPALPEGKIELAKVEFRDAIARRNEDAEGIAGREFGRIIYGKGSPYAREVEYDTVDAIKRADLVAFHQRYFQPENIILGAWGDFDTAQMRTLLEKTFGGWPRGGQPRPVAPTVDATAAQRAGLYVVNKEDVTQSTVLLGYLGGRQNDPDATALSVLSTILGGGFSSRLMSHVRTDQGLAYNVGGGFGANYDYPGVFRVEGGTKSETTLKIISSIRHEIEDLKTGNVTDEEFSRAKDSVLKGFAFDFDSTAKIVSRLLAYEYYSYPRDFLQQRQAKLRQLTKEDVAAAARKYLQPQNLAVLVVGKTKDFEAPLSSLGKVQELDITIPPPSAQKTAAPTSANVNEGRELLAKVRTAMGGAALVKITGYQEKFSLGMETPQGPMTMEANRTVSLKGKSVLVMSTPMGEITQGYNGQKAWVKTPQGLQELPAAAADESAHDAAREMVRLLVTPDNQAQSLGETDFDGQKALGLAITNPAQQLDVKLYLDPRTYLPRGKRFQSGSLGGQAEEVYDDYRDVDGVKVPFKVTVSANGRKRATQQIKELKFNAEVNEKAFDPQ